MERGYTFVHETKRQWRAVGGSATPSGRAVAQRPGSARGGAASGLVTFFGKPLEGGGGRGRLSGFGGKGSTRTTGAAVGAARPAGVPPGSDPRPRALADRGRRAYATRCPSDTSPVH